MFTISQLGPCQEFRWSGIHGKLGKLQGHLVFTLFPTTNKDEFPDPAL
jgi:hypothetical protein